VTSTDTIAADLGRSGGQALLLVPATAADREEYDALRR
jgi:hypothetical protein